jgi:leader peptidase (prepilin peptidase)/N-methyltransferase
MALLSIVLASTLVGAAVGAAMLSFQGRDKATPIPFGPFLAAGGLVEFFWRGGVLGLVGL